MEASIELAAGTEGVAAADELQMHSKVSAERGKQLGEGARPASS